MLRQGEPYLRGEPLRIDFLGFRSDTYALQRAGWEIAEERSHYDHTFRIAIRHPAHKMSGMSQPIRWRAGYVPDRMRGLIVFMELAIQFMITKYEQPEHHPMFFPVDTTPAYETFEQPVLQDLYDMPYFRPIDEGKEIFLRKASVDEIMQIALDKQEPEQARIRAARSAEQRREDYARGGTTKAKLIMVA